MAWKSGSISIGIKPLKKLTASQGTAAAIIKPSRCQGREQSDLDKEISKDDRCARAERFVGGDRHAPPLDERRNRVRDAYSAG